MVKIGKIVEIRNHFTNIEKITKGYQSTIYKAINSSNEPIAIKKLKSDKYFNREIKNLNSQMPEYCISLLDNFSDKKNNEYLVFKYYPCSLKEYFDENMLALETVKKWALQISLGMMKLHEMSIIHRDLKPENILLTEKSPYGDIVITDFGFSINTAFERPVSSLGTFNYYAPEILTGEYNEKVDVYSYGVIVYLTLFDSFPRFVNSQLTLPISHNLSPDEFSSCIAFLRKLLDHDPIKRPSFAEISKDIFLQGIYYKLRSKAIQMKNEENLSIDDNIRQMQFIRDCQIKINVIYKGLYWLEQKIKENTNDSDALSIEMLKYYCFSYIIKTFEGILTSYPRFKLNTFKSLEYIQSELQYFIRIQAACKNRLEIGNQKGLLSFNDLFELIEKLIGAKDSENLNEIKVMITFLGEVSRESQHQ